MSRGVRACWVLLAFGVTAAPGHTALLLLVSAARGAVWLAPALGLKLLVNAATQPAAVEQRAHEFLVAALFLAAAVAGQHPAAQVYVRLTVAVVEAAGLAAERRLMALSAGIAGIEHHERPDFLDRMELIRSERDGLGWMVNDVVLLVLTVVQAAGAALLLVRLDRALAALLLFAAVRLLAARRADALEQRATEATAESRRLKGCLFDLATSASAGKELRVCGAAPTLLGHYATAWQRISAARSAAALRAAGLNAAGGLVFAVGFGGAVALVLRRALLGEATPGDVVLAVTLAGQMTGALHGVSGTIGNLLRTVQVGTHYLWIEDYAAAAVANAASAAHEGPEGPVRVVDRLSRAMVAVGAAAGPGPEPARAAVPARLASGITLEHVSFRYPATDRPVLEDVCLDLGAGAVVALVGENGAGKSTLVKLLYRLYEPTDGRIRLDGTDLRHLAPDEWRADISATFQDFVRYEFLAREAVGVGHLPRMHDQSAIQTALARGAAQGVIAALPSGLDTQLGTTWEGGIDLSSGQWQKLALARGAMRPDPLLRVFDEPTAALDPQTEQVLFETVAAQARSGQNRGSATVIVSHRFSTVRMADLIVVLGRGRVLETGSHASLMAQGGVYAELFALQSRAYRT